MELKIKEKKVKRKREPHYKLTINFMEGDADGYQTQTHIFDENSIESLKQTIMAIARCNAAYPNGRGGYDEYDGLPEYDAFFNDDLDLDCYDDLLSESGLEEGDQEEFEYVQNHLKEKYNPYDIELEHPYDSNYIHTYFDGYFLVYVDENGDKCDVDITFTKEEQKYIDKAGEILN